MNKISARSQGNLALTLSLFLILCFSAAAQANPGDLDTGFGVGGKVITSVGTYDSGSRMAIQSSGKIIVAGVTRRPDDSGYYNILLMRYNPNGSLDTSFDGDGIVITSLASPLGGVTDVAISGGDKIVIVGSIEGTPQTITEFLVVRYNANGTLDTTFDTDGIVQTNIGPSTDTARAVAIQTDGKIVVAGNAYLAGSYYCVVRYNADGSIDNTFSKDGIVTTAVNFPDIPSAANDVAIQSDGKIVVAGMGDRGSGNGFNDFALIRYNQNGSRDFTFGGGGGDLNGSTTTDFYNRTDGINQIVIRNDNKIIAVGQADTGTVSGNRNAAVAQYNANGILEFKYDTSFSSIANDNAVSVKIQPDLKVVVLCSTRPQSGIADFGLFRLLPNQPTLDTNFRGGKFTTDIGSNSEDSPSDLALQSDGKIIALGGISFTGGSDVVLVRYHGDGTSAMSRAPFDFDGDNKTDLSIYRPSVGEWWYLKSSDGGNSAFQFGTSTDKLVPADYTGDGKTDIAFYRPASGEWFVLRSENYSFYSFPFGNAGDVPQVGDFDADGKADATVYRPSTSVWYTLRSTDGAAVIQGFGQAGDVPVMADYDGDRQADIAIFRPSVGEWWILRSTLGGIVYQFGNSSDKPVQGDFTGDGKADVAFFRPSSGEWFVLRSENLSYYSFPFGSNGDLPAPGDYDGDGKFDAAVFRPSSNTWYAHRATAGTLIQSFGQSGDYPVPNALVP